MVFWILFHVLVFGALAFDLGVAHRKPGVIAPKEALRWSGVWLSLALLFGAYILMWYGSDPFVDYITVYAVEKTLSLDNLFVFLLIFKKLRIEAAYHHKLLFWGIIGAIVFRAIAILLGIEALERFSWMIYIFGIILIASGVQFFRETPGDKEHQPYVYQILRPFLNRVREDHKGQFFHVEKGRIIPTILLLGLLYIELADIMFAIDSVPAALAITRDFKLVYTANIMAILGLRSLFFLLSHTVEKIPSLHKGLAVTLIFIGVKICLSPILEIPSFVTLLVVLTAFGVSYARDRYFSENSKS